MLDTVFGLPVHPLVVHATVVIVPAAVVAVALAAVWRRFRRWAGFLPLLLAAVSLVLVPVSTSSGESLERRVPRTALLEAHTRLADGLLLPVVVLAVAAVGLYWVHLGERSAPSATAAPAAAAGAPSTSTHGRVLAVARAGPGRILVLAVLVLAAVGVIGSTVQVVRIGHSGAQAAWSDVAQSPPGGGQGDG